MPRCPQETVLEAMQKRANSAALTDDQEKLLKIDAL
jgi:hypothetical protein